MAGKKYDSDKPKLTMVDPVFLADMARILEGGERKYGRDNWKGLEISRILDATKRHVAAIEMGEDWDPDSGLSHTAHAACSLMFIHYMQRYGGKDDRRFSEAVSPMRHGSDSVEHDTESDEKTRLDMQPMRQPEGDREHQEKTSIEALADRVTHWADGVFPDRTPQAALTKMVIEEIPELLNGGLNDPGEYADVLIMLVDLANLKGFDIVAAAHEKMDINERRSWAVDPKTGTLSHIRGE